MLRQILCYLLIFTLILISGCTTDTIKDTVTTEELAIFDEQPSSLEKVIVNSDSMLSYSTYSPLAKDNNVFIDQSYYHSHSITRGDIVMFKTDDANLPRDFGRIIGLPAEEVNLKKGHIYINGKRLDAFYGSEFRENSEYEKNPTTLERPVLLGEGEYFVLGDYWQRSFHDSKERGSIVQSDIIGKVVGWEGPKTAWDYQNGIIVGIEGNRVAVVRDVSVDDLRTQSTEGIIGIAFPEVIWVASENAEKIQGFKIGDTVKYELITGTIENTTPLQAKAKNFERTGSVLEQR